MASVPAGAGSAVSWAGRSFAFTTPRLPYPTTAPPPPTKPARSLPLPPSISDHRGPPPHPPTTSPLLHHSSSSLPGPLLTRLKDPPAAYRLLSAYHPCHPPTPTQKHTPTRPRTSPELTLLTHTLALHGSPPHRDTAPMPHQPPTAASSHSSASRPPAAIVLKTT